ncbi:hypothetical protein FRC02_000430 [Tulasnella sp. 418]|nr:hypothetical protein FRC02_000430 [Tulasnella sp. 418]
MPPKVKTAKSTETDYADYSFGKVTKMPSLYNECTCKAELEEKKIWANSEQRLWCTVTSNKYRLKINPGKTFVILNNNATREMAKKGERICWEDCDAALVHEIRFAEEKQKVYGQVSLVNAK